MSASAYVKVVNTAADFNPWKVISASALGLSKRCNEYLISGRKLETRRIGTRVLIPAGSLRRFARANHFDSVAS